jgi:AcrR family transcriptional regulator
MAPTSEDQRSTRERILDVALDLFIEQGYDKTSLREVAERMGFTKAALYYHFPSKADMLGALHERMHSLMDAPLAVLGEGQVNVQRFERFLDVCIEKMEANQKLFVLHRVNQAAIGKMHLEGHTDRHIDLEERARRIFSDTSIKEADRVRMAASFAATMLTPMIANAWFEPAAAAGFKQTLKDIVHQVLRPGRPRRKAAVDPDDGDEAAPTTGSPSSPTGPLGPPINGQRARGKAPGGKASSPRASRGL